MRPRRWWRRSCCRAGPAGEFDYLVPAEMIGGPRPERTLEAGRRVRVPLGRSNRSVVGYCVDVAMKPAGGRKLKAVAAVLDRGPLLSPAMLRVTRWMADYYLCPWGRCWRRSCRRAFGTMRAAAM